MVWEVHPGSVQTCLQAHIHTPFPLPLASCNFWTSHLGFLILLIYGACWSSAGGWKPDLQSQAARPSLSLAHRKGKPQLVHRTQVHRVLSTGMGLQSSLSAVFRMSAKQICHFLYPTESLKESSRDPLPQCPKLGTPACSKVPNNSLAPQRPQRKARPCLPRLRCESDHATSHPQPTAFQL